MSGYGCDPYGALKPQALGGPSGAGMAAAAGAGYSLMHPCTISLAIFIIAFLLFLLVVYLVRPQWARVKTPDGQVTDQLNFGAMLIWGLIFAIVIALIAFFLCKLSR